MAAPGREDEPIEMLFHRFAKSILRGLLAILLDYEVVGLENVPRKGPLIVAINHMNFLDPVLATVLIPRDIVSMAKAELFGYPLVGLVFGLYGAFPVRRGEIDRRALRKAMAALKEEKALLMAPEGTRGGDWRLIEARDGVAYVALRASVPILPMAISGSERFWKELARLRRTKTRIVVGEPFFLVPEEGKVTREQLREMTAEAMYRLAALLPPQYRGVYSDLSAATEEHIRPYKGAS
jgi:1-acyl-sn-glycerol-3-phosphate acyltransferase